MDHRRNHRAVSSDLMEMEGGAYSPRDQKAHKESSLFSATGEPHADAQSQEPPSATRQAAQALDRNTEMVLKQKHRSWSRHLTLYTILGNTGMLLTVVSNNHMGVLSRVFCIGTYGHVFMEGSLLIRLLFPPSRNYQLQKLHNYWGIVTLLMLVIFGNTFGELLWAAESILTDSMSLILGAWLIQAKVTPQVKLVGLSHFIHGITFEFFLWFDIAALSASYSSTRGIFWVILVLANAISQMVFHGPVIRGDFAASDLPQTPSPQARSKLVWLWLCHNVLSIPLVLVFSTLGDNHFYLEETRILPMYQVMIYVVPMTGLMYILYTFLKSKHAPFISLGEENGVDCIGKPVDFEVAYGALPTRTAQRPRSSVETMTALGEVLSGVTGNMLHAVVQLLLGTAFAATAIMDTGKEPFLPMYIALPLTLPMVLAGVLALGKSTGTITDHVWKAVAGPIFFIATLVSMFTISGTGLGYWSAWGILTDQSALPAFLIVCGTLYTAWSAWILVNQVAHAMRGCAKGN